MGEPRLAEIKNLNGSAGIISKFDYGYDSIGQITSWTQQSDSSDPQNWAMQYDNEGKLLGVNVTDTTTSALLHQYAYLYDAAGNRTTEQIDGNATGSSYNNLNQLTGQSAGGQMVFSGTLSKPSQVTVAGNAATYGNYYSTNFVGMANVSAGTNSVPVIAHDVNGNTATNTYQVVVPPASASFSYDLNGCLLTDGARTFGWDAKKELVSIIYNTGANAGNHTEFTYNGAGERVKIAELTGTTIGSGTVTSVKQFVYAGGMAEERDASNTVTKRFFAQGEQRISSGTATNYFYTRDHLGSIREMMASDGTTIAARYSYDPYGRPTEVSGSISCDFQYAGMYEHATSGLNLTKYRAYDPNLGRWLSRDPSGEGSGLNLYAYAADSPIDNIDPSGLDVIVVLNRNAVPLGPAGNAGHVGEIIGNDQSGYKYISYGPVPGGGEGSGGMVSSKGFSNLTDAMNYAQAQGYTDFADYSTTPAQDAAASRVAYPYNGTTYYAPGNDCEDAVISSMTAAGLNPNTSAMEPSSFFDQNSANAAATGTFGTPTSSTPTGYFWPPPGDSPDGSDGSGGCIDDAD